VPALRTERVQASQRKCPPSRGPDGSSGACDGPRTVSPLRCPARRAVALRPPDLRNDLPGRALEGPEGRHGGESRHSGARNPRWHSRAVPGPHSRYAEHSMTPRPRQRTTSPSTLAAAPHPGAVGPAQPMSLPLLGLLARISLSVALREATEMQTDGRRPGTVGVTESPPGASRPDVAANVVVHPPEAVRPAGHDEVWSIVAGYTFPPYQVDDEGLLRSAGDGG
jgi:hypothetical protein